MIVAPCACDYLFVSNADSFGRHHPVLTERIGDPGAADAAASPVVPLSAEPLDIKALFSRHYASIARLLRRLGVGSSQLDDAAQEVFWVAARRLSDIVPGREPAFLYGVALRVASNVLRRQNAVPPMTELSAIESLAHHGPSPEEELQQRRARALLDAVLERLPLELRTVFVLFELEGIEVKDIAELEEIPIGTASSRLRRAREEFSAIAKRLRATLAAGRKDLLMPPGPNTCTVQVNDEGHRVRASFARLGASGLGLRGSRAGCVVALRSVSGSGRVDRRSCRGCHYPAGACDSAMRLSKGWLLVRSAAARSPCR